MRVFKLPEIKDSVGAVGTLEKPSRAIQLCQEQRVVPATLKNHLADFN